MSERVTLYRCKECGSGAGAQPAISIKKVCPHKGVEPIVYAPLPSESTRATVREWLSATAGCDEDSEQQNAALAELEAAWSDK